MGCRCPFGPAHSKKPSAGTAHRLFLNASLKAGRFSNVSARALICLEPIFGSFAQWLTRPQRAGSISRSSYSMALVFRKLADRHAEFAGKADSILSGQREAAAQWQETTARSQVQ